MRLRSVSIAMRAVLPLLLTPVGCSKSSVQRPPADSTTPPAPPAASPAASSNRQLVQPAALPASVRATCDTAAALVHEAFALQIKRENGSYFDSFKEVPRVGCRLSAEGSFATLRD